MNQNLPIKLRPVQADDLNFIYATWLNSYRVSKFNPIRGPLYYYYQEDLIYKILNRAQVMIVCDDRDLGQIHSYAVYETIGNVAIVHWIYTKEVMRSFGLGGMLLSAILGQKADMDNEIIITHKGVHYDFYKDKFSHIYKPELAFGQIKRKKK